MKPIIKYPGGKEKELKFILPNLPDKIDNFYEPFVGGGSVYFAMNDLKHYFINDKCKDLINYYKMMQKQDKMFFNYLNDINEGYKKIDTIFNRYCDELCNDYANTDVDAFFTRHKTAINKILCSVPNGELIHYLKKDVKSKIAHIAKLEKANGKLNNESDIKDNVLCGFKSGYYMYMRHLFNTTQNKELRTVLYVFMREYCYSSMFRYNAKGEFNVPFGGISYNNKYLDNKVAQMQSKEYIKRFKSTKFSCQDFYDFMTQFPPGSDDFVFLDPPYDTEFSNYANADFNKQDQIRLRDYLINECKGKWMLVIKNTDFIYGLYNNQGLNIQTFDKHYLVSFKNRNNKDCEHLLIKNY